VSVPILEALLSAAPRLRVCEADVRFSDATEARRALRNDGVFGPLRVHATTLVLDRADAAMLVPLFADVAAHASLTDLVLFTAHFDVPEVLDSFVDAALSLPLLRTVQLSDCFLSPVSAPALARLLGSSTLPELVIYHYGHALLDAPAAALLSGALRANSTLTSLMLHGAHLWSNHAAATALLGALTGHVSVRRLRIFNDGMERSLENLQCAGMLLGALVAADAPALAALDVHGNALSDDGLRPLFEALPGNTHLRTLNCSYNDMSDAFAAAVLLPAVRANTSLRTLNTHVGVPQSDAVREAHSLVMAPRRGANLDREAAAAV
jgi:Ran GTPase-activating protein (RanGAP) involved in mRNA processing and transport